LLELINLIKSNNSDLKDMATSTPTIGEEEEDKEEWVY